MMRNRSLRALAISLLLPGLLASLPLAAGHASPVRAAATRALRPLTVWLDWYPNSDHAGIYVALARGYYAQAGLDVHARVPAGAADALSLVADGSGDVAISYEPDVLLARQKGLPVVATAALVQRPLSCIMTLHSSGIARPRQLQGRLIGISGTPGDYANIKALVGHDGGNPASVRTIVVDYGLLQALLSRRVAAVEGVYWTWEALQAGQQGYAVNVMRVDAYGVPGYDELVLVTGQGQLKNEPGVLRAFQRATLRGYAYAAAHPAEAARDVLTAPGVLSHSSRLIEQSISLLGPLFHDAQGRYGTLSISAWQAYADWMTRAHIIPSHFDASAALTTSLLP